MEKNIPTHFQSPPPPYLELLDCRLRRLEQWKPSKQSCQVSLEVSADSDLPGTADTVNVRKYHSFLNVTIALLALESHCCNIFSWLSMIPYQSSLISDQILKSLTHSLRSLDLVI